MLLANFNGKEHLRHRAVSLRQHGFFVSVTVTVNVTFRMFYINPKLLIIQISYIKYYAAQQRKTLHFHTSDNVTLLKVHDISLLLLRSHHQSDFCCTNVNSCEMDLSSKTVVCLDNGSLSKTLSRFLVNRFRFPNVQSLHTENTRFTYSCEVGADNRSWASGATLGY